MPYDQKQLDDLSLRAKRVLGSQAHQTLLQSKPRLRAYAIAMDRAIKAMGSPEKVTDEQILGAMEIAHEVFPVELEALSPIFSQQTAKQQKPSK